jgi:hypothetical protein
VHIGVIQGQAWLPWMVLCELSLARTLLPARSDVALRRLAIRALPAVLGLSAVIGAICLTGEPRTIVDAEVVTLIVVLVELVAHGQAVAASVRGRVAYVGTCVVAIAWGAAIAAIQLLPAWGFISLSERSRISLAFYSSGTLSGRWLTLLLSQGLLGANGALGTPGFFASYNLPEVTGYAGLAALVALVAFASQLVARRSSAPRRRYVAFFALAITGLVFTTAGHTPLGALLHEFPLYGSTRLPNRNLAVFDLGVAVLLGWWLDAVASNRREEAALTGRRRLVTLLPLGLTAVLCSVALVDPGFVTVTLLNDPGSQSIARGIRITVAISLLLAVAYVVVLVRRHVSVARATRALVVVVLVDLAFCNVFFQTGLVTGLSSITPDTQLARHELGTVGRSALVDPAVGEYHSLAPLGMANLDVFTRLPSVQGYAALMAGRYSGPTGTRFLLSLSGCALARGVFEQLRLESLVVSESALDGARKVVGAASDCGAPPESSIARRYFGAVVHVLSIRFEGPNLGLSDGRLPRVLLLSADGSTLAARPRLSAGSRHSLTAAFVTSPAAAGVEVLDARGVGLASAVLLVASGHVEALNTAMQRGLDQREWRLVAVRGTLSYFRAAHIPGEVWLTNAARGSSARVVTSSSTGTLTAAVTTRIATWLVRSETWLPGWSAIIASPSGAISRTAAVVPNGLVQSVKVPKGTWNVTFTYHAPHLRAGIVVTAGALAALLAALLVLARARRRQGASLATDT